MSELSEAVKAEYARLSKRFRLRMEFFERMKRRHEEERALVYGDLVEAGAEKDRFEREHPEVRP